MKGITMRTAVWYGLGDLLCTATAAYLFIDCEHRPRFFVPIAILLFIGALLGPDGLPSWRFPRRGRSRVGIARWLFVLTLVILIAWDYALTEVGMEIWWDRYAIARSVAVAYILLAVGFTIVSAFGQRTDEPRWLRVTRFALLTVFLTAVVVDGAMKGLLRAIITAERRMDAERPHTRYVGRWRRGATELVYLKNTHNSKAALVIETGLLEGYMPKPVFWVKDDPGQLVFNPGTNVYDEVRLPWDSKVVWEYGKPRPDTVGELTEEERQLLDGLTQDAPLTEEILNRVWGRPTSTSPTTTRRDDSAGAVTSGPASRPSSAPAPAQGVRGAVVKLVGDFLPGAEPARGGHVPLVVLVHVFRGRVQPFEKPDPHHAALVTIVRPDKEGRFSLPLPPGEYTLVAEIDGRLYLNNWLDDGSWATVTVRPGRWSDYTIEDVTEATFRPGT